MLFGDNGIISKNISAKISYEESVYKDIITLEVTDERIVDTEEPIIYLTNIQHELEKNRKFDGSEYQILNNNTLKITTKEGYKFAVIKDKVIELGNNEDNINKPIIKSFNVEVIDGVKIRINATAEDREFGISHFNYSITPVEGIEAGKAEGTFKSGKPIQVTSIFGDEYTVTITAENNLGIKSEEQSKTVETFILKSIQTAEGEKIVKARDLYGSNVYGYKGGRTDVQWQVFYIDEKDSNRIYLIANDYVVPPLLRADSGLSRGPLEVESLYPKTYCWSSAIEQNNFKGKTVTIPNTAFTQKFLKEYAGTTGTASKLHATNYMLDQNIWKEYIGGNVVEAYGGPTLPLLQESWNDISRVATGIFIERRDNGDKTGYVLRKTREVMGYSAKNLGTESTQNGIYFKSINNGPAWAMWIASPAFEQSGRGYYGDEMINSFGCDGQGLQGTFGVSDIHADGLGFRPVVALELGTELIDNNNGTYTIK